MIHAQWCTHTHVCTNLFSNEGHLILRLGLVALGIVIRRCLISLLPPANIVTRSRGRLQETRPPGGGGDHYELPCG